MKLWIDTNVLIDVLAKRQPFHDDSAKVWALVEAGQAEGYISAISFNNVFYIVRRFGNRQKAHRAVVALSQLFQVAPVDAKTLQRAISASISDFEDAIQWISATDLGVDRFITRNTRDFPATTPVVLTPTEFFKTLDNP